MKVFHRTILLLALLAAPLAAAPGMATAQTGGGYDLTWNTQDGGGIGISKGGAYELGGTIGQPDASAAHTAGGYELRGGFWQFRLYRAYVPRVVKLN
jgi:hypothetical protein